MAIPPGKEKAEGYKAGASQEETPRSLRNVLAPMHDQKRPVVLTGAMLRVVKTVADQSSS